MKGKQTYAILSLTMPVEVTRSKAMAVLRGTDITFPVESIVHLSKPRRKIHLKINGANTHPKSQKPELLLKFSGNQCARIPHEFIEEAEFL